MRSWPHSRLDLILRHGRRDYKNGSLTPGSLAETLAPIRQGVMTFCGSLGEDSVNAGLRRTELPGLEDEARPATITRTLSRESVPIFSLRRDLSAVMTCETLTTLGQGRSDRSYLMNRSRYPASTQKTSRLPLRVEVKKKYLPSRVTQGRFSEPGELTSSPMLTGRPQRPSFPLKEM